MQVFIAVNGAHYAPLPAASVIICGVLHVQSRYSAYPDRYCAYLTAAAAKISTRVYRFEVWNWTSGRGFASGRTLEAINTGEELSVTSVQLLRWSRTASSMPDSASFILSHGLCRCASSYNPTRLLQGRSSQQRCFSSSRVAKRRAAHRAMQYTGSNRRNQTSLSLRLRRATHLRSLSMDTK